MTEDASTYIYDTRANLALVSNKHHLINEHKSQTQLMKMAKNLLSISLTNPWLKGPDFVIYWRSVGINSHQKLSLACFINNTEVISWNPEVTFYVWDISLLTLNVLGPSYLGLTRSISWLLMPLLLTSPGHQQPWYWLWRICKSWSDLRRYFKCLCHINVE